MKELYLNLLLYMSLVVRKPVFGVSDLVRHKPVAVQSQKMARGLKFRNYVVEGLYYPCSENKGTDQLRGNQLRGYREADLHLCFRICKRPVFSERGSYKSLFFQPIFMSITISCMM